MSTDTPSHHRRRRPQLHPTVMAAMQVRPLVLALSGGGDSMALLELVHRLHRRGRIPGPILGAHLNHQQRDPFSNEAENLLREECARRGIELSCVSFDSLVESIHPPQGHSLEAWLAEYRHQWIATTATNWNTNSLILTGHQADDLAESLLLGLMRGNSLGGLSFPVFQTWCGVDVASPLTLCRREDLRSWLIDRGIPWMEDPMNTDPHGARSAIRCLLANLQTTTHRDWVAPLVRSAESLRETGDYLRNHLIELLPCYLDGSGRLDVRKWRHAHPGIREPLLRAFCSMIGVTPAGRHVHELSRWLMTGPLQEGRFLLGDHRTVGVVQSGCFRMEQSEGVSPKVNTP